MKVLRKAAAIRRNKRGMLRLVRLQSVLGDPDPDVLGPPGYGSISQRYESFPFLIKLLRGLK
jgi:hypothetical protein